MQPNNFSASRILALDGIRGIAFLMVFFCHLSIFGTGQFGVDLFFVLSGFLITSILLQEQKRNGSINIGKFYLRRALRLLPALFAVVLGVLLYTLIILPYPKFLLALSDVWRIVLYVWNWTLASDWNQIVERHQEMYTHLWSLSVEEQFYIVWPCLVMLLLRVSRSIVLLFLIVGMIVPAILRLLLWDEGSALWIYFRTDLRFDNLLYGALVAWVLYWGYEPKDLSRTVLSWAGVVAFIGLIGIAIPNFITHGEIYTHGLFSLVALFAAVLIASAVWCPLAPLRWFLEFKPLCWVGKVSYGLYLWHWPIILVVTRLMLPSTIITDLIIITTLLAITAISYYKLELPFLRLKDRIGGHTNKPSGRIVSPQMSELSPQTSYQNAE